MRSFSPAGVLDSPPQKQATAQPTTKSSWCSSPFSNLVALSPDCNSLSFHLDFSPGTTFNSPHMKFPPDHTQASPQTNLSHHQRENFSSLFSPSIFSPFNKTLKASKMDKSSSVMYGDFLDSNEPHSVTSKLIPDDENNDQEDNFFKHSHMPAYHSVDMQNININFAGHIDDQSQRAELSAGILSIDTENRSGSSSCSSSSKSTDTETETLSITKTSPKSKKNRNTSGNSKKGRNAVNNVDGGVKTSTATSASKAHNLFGSPAVVVRGSNQQPSNISPAGTEATGGHCNCKKSKCLKLYCECFAALRYCNGCNCVECHNCPAHEKERQEAIIVTRERNSQAFMCKVNVNQGHTAGCNCKKSQCLKKYCECFEASVFCGDNCKCLTCQNFSGSEKLADVKRHSTEKREKSQSVSVLTKELPSPHILTVKNVALPAFPLKQHGRSQGVASIPNKHISAVTKLTPEGESTGGTHFTTPSATPNTSLALHKKRNRRSLVDSDLSSSDDGLPPRRKASRGYTTTSPSSIASQSEASGSSTQELSPSDKLLDMLEASDSSPELSLLHSAEKVCSGHNDMSGSLSVIEPRYPFFGQQNHRTTKLTALRCLEFLDNRELYSVSLVNRLWSQAAMDDALWE